MNYYSLQNDIPACYRPIFDTPLADLLTGNTYKLQSWTNKFGPIIHKGVKEYALSTQYQNRDIRDFINIPSISEQVCALLPADQDY